MVNFLFFGSKGCLFKSSHLVSLFFLIIVNYLYHKKIKICKKNKNNYIMGAQLKLIYTNTKREGDGYAP